jgi:GAF domain-containing protein
MHRLLLAVQELSLARDLADVQRIVRTAARELTQCDGATFVLRDNGKCYYADEDAIAPLWKGLRFPLEACISGWAMLNKQSAVIPDIYADPRIPHEAYRPTFVKSLVMVPIRKLDPLGAIGNYWATPHQPTSEEIALLQALADATSVAMNSVTVNSELEKRAQDRSDLQRELDEETRSLSELTAKVNNRIRDLSPGLQ